MNLILNRNENYALFSYSADDLHPEFINTVELTRVLNNAAQPVARVVWREETAHPVALTVLVHTGISAQPPHSPSPVAIPHFFTKAQN